MISCEPGSPVHYHCAIGYRIAIAFDNEWVRSVPLEAALNRFLSLLAILDRSVETEG